MTEIGFLLDLLFEKKSLKAMRESIVARIKEVETNPQIRVQPQPTFTTYPISNPQHPLGPPQSPSTIAALQRHGITDPTAIATIPAPQMPEVPQQPAVIAQTPAAAAAINQRNETIANAINGKVDKNRTSPRKW